MYSKKLRMNAPLWQTPDDWEESVKDHPMPSVAKGRTLPPQVRVQLPRENIPAHHLAGVP